MNLPFSKIRRRFTLVVNLLFSAAQPRSRAVIRSARVDDGRILLSGWAFSNFQFENCTFVVRKFRDEKISFSYGVNVVRDRKFYFLQYILSQLNLHWLFFTVKIDVPWAELPASIYGLGFKTGSTAVSLRLNTSAIQLLSDDAAQRTYCVFTEPSTLVPRIEMFHFGSETVAEIKEYARQVRDDALACVIGEYTNSARDNGMVLFEWLRENAPDIQASYIVEAINADGYSLAPDDVLEFGSVAHLKACLDAQVCAFTHHRGYTYPYIIKLVAAARYDQTQTLFLQHGVIALKKNISAHYNFSRVGYDAFCVSSQLEKTIVIDHFGYPPSNVIVTGLARLDRLVAQSTSVRANPREILVFPTWRPGLDKLPSTEIEEHPFILHWQEALQKLRATDLHVSLIIHPVLARHIDLFTPYVDNVREAQDFQEAILNASALVTDFSSVSFDALFLKKPVFLFQFDQDTHASTNNTYVKTESQMPGQCSTTSAALYNDILNSYKNGWSFDFFAQHALYFDSCDDQNASRIANVIRSLKPIER